MTTATAGGSDTDRLGDRYRLGALLASGGMADVYRATDEALEREVAVKVLRQIAGGDDAQARFVHEARLLAGLSHTGLVTVLDAGFEDERPFLVMELVEGRTFEQLCAGRPCDEQVVEDVGAQIAQALSFVHGRGIVHRDVKPANVLIGADGRVKLADFGIARLAGRDAEFTRTGFIMGTVRYVSPEQVRGAELTGAADVYSLGLVLLEALTGKREYGGTDLEAVQERLRRPPRLLAEVSPRWAALLGAMTALDPADRPSAAEVAERLRSATTEPVAATRRLPPAPATPPRVARPVPQHWWVLAGAATVFLVLLLVAAFASGSGGSVAGDPTSAGSAEVGGSLADVPDTAPELADRVDAVDRAVDDGDPRRARKAIDELVAATARARVAGELSAEEAEAILRAAAELLRELPEPRDRGPAR